MKNLIPALSITVIIISLTATSCGNKQEQTEQSKILTDTSQTRASRADEEVVNLTGEQSERILAEYLDIKNALVQTDREAAANAATNLVAVIGESAEDFAGKIRSSARSIAGSKAVDDQRDHFNALSENIYTLVKVTRANDVTLYRQYCPMAMNNNGAYWLSAEEEVRNPYFGDKMLKCGSVKETIN